METLKPGLRADCRMISIPYTALLPLWFENYNCIIIQSGWQTMKMRPAFASAIPWLPWARAGSWWLPACTGLPVVSRMRRNRYCRSCLRHGCTRALVTHRPCRRVSATDDRQSRYAQACLYYTQGPVSSWRGFRCLPDHRTCALPPSSRRRDRLGGLVRRVRGMRLPKPLSVHNQA